MKRNAVYRPLALAGTVAGLMALSVAAQARPDVAPARIVSPDANYYGKSYADWSAAWWQHMMALPCSRNPMLDNTGACCMIDQSGPVVFLAGTWGGVSNASRGITITDQTSLFFPIYNVICDNGGFDPQAQRGLGRNQNGAPVPEPTNYTVSQLRAMVDPSVAQVTGLFAILDNQNIPNLARHRALSPVFTYTLPVTDNLWQKTCGLPNGTYHFHGPMEVIADGYYLMLEPLPVGFHTLSFGVKGQMGITYYINVTPIP